MPFPADDQVYGNRSGRSDDVPGVVFGAVGPRGEQGVVCLTLEYFFSVKYKPFFGFQESYLRKWLDDLFQVNLRGCITAGDRRRLRYLFQVRTGKLFNILNGTAHADEIWWAAA